MIEYNEDEPTYGDKMTVEQFRSYVRQGLFVDSDGHGCPAKDGKMAHKSVYPSALSSIPTDATHIIWFNK